MDAKEIAKIRRDIEKVRRSCNGVRVLYPQSIKKSVLEVMQSGMSLAAVAKLTGLSTSTIFSWSQDGNKVSFRRVKVSAKKAITNISSDHELKVTLPNGICIEGASTTILKEIFGWFE